MWLELRIVCTGSVMDVECLNYALIRMYSYQCLFYVVGPFFISTGTSTVAVDQASLLFRFLSGNNKTR